MSHLSRYPAERLASSEHHGCVGVARLIRATVTHAGFSQSKLPRALPYPFIARPRFIGAGVSKYVTAFKEESDLFLSAQSL